MARLRAGLDGDDDLPDVAVLLRHTVRPWAGTSPTQKFDERSHLTKATQRLGAGGASNLTADMTSGVTSATANDARRSRQRPLKHISGNSLLVPMATSERAALGQRADCKDADREPRTVRHTPRRRARHMQADTLIDDVHEETIVEEAASSPADASYQDEDEDESSSESDSDDSLEAIKFWGGRNPRPTPKHRKTARRRCSTSTSPSPQRQTPRPTLDSQYSADIIDLTSTPSPKKQLPCLQPPVRLPVGSRPASSDSNHGAILTFDPPVSRSPRKAPPRPKTPPASTPPPSPSKGKLLSPSKRAQRIAAAPFRPSIDAFWSATVVNEWNDQHSPKKECLTSPRKKRFQDLLDRSAGGNSSSSDGDAPPSPSTSPRKSPTKRNNATAVRRRVFEAAKHAIADDFLRELDTRITDGKIAELAAGTGGVKLIWSKRLNSTAGRANWRRETVRTTTPDGSKTTTCRHEASIELAEKVIDDEERLINVLAHEFCHLANFMVSGVKDRPHGREFKQWAAKVSRAFGSRGVEVTTKHSYDIDYKYVWECEECGLEFKRHSKSIDPAKHSCGSCKSRLVQTKPKPRGGATGGYAGFVKENFAVVKRENPGASHGAVMEMLGRLYKERKAGAAGTPSSDDSKADRAVDDIAEALGVVDLDG